MRKQKEPHNKNRLSVFLQSILMAIVSGLISGYLVFYLTTQPNVEMIYSKMYTNETYDFYDIILKNVGLKDAKISILNLTTYGYFDGDVNYESNLERNVVEPQKLKKYLSFDNKTVYALSNFHLSPGEELELDMLFTKNITIDSKVPSIIREGPSTFATPVFIIISRPAIENLTIIIDNEYSGRIIMCDSEIKCTKRTL